MRRPPITVRGARRLKEEVQRLKTVERPRIIRAIAEARAHGDLRENAEYHAAKEEQSFTEGRLAEIQDCLARAEVIDTRSVRAEGKVVFGATVELCNLETDQEVRFQIVGEMEADIDEGLISVTSPLAKALIGKREGDVAEVRAPAGDIEFEILEVAYAS
jgi:transcription elongation factor GreA